MGSLTSDIRYALRSLRKNPGFTAVVVLTLALGIGANTAIFSVVNAVLLRPLPYPESDRLVELTNRGPQQGRFSMSYPDIQELRALTQEFTGIAAYSTQRYNLAAEGEPREVRVALASDELFRVLRVEPMTPSGWSQQSNWLAQVPLSRQGVPWGTTSVQSLVRQRMRLRFSALTESM